MRALPRAACILAAVAFLLIAHASAYASAKRVVVLKVDGLSHGRLDREVRERDPRTGKSFLPWIERVFYESGTRVENFYVRGMSLSGPSWSLLDTGRHLQIKGNVEFDRFTLRSYDYLNFFPFWLANARGRRADMPGVETLDEVGLPLLIDAYPYEERYASFQLYQRGTRWTTLQRGLLNRFTSRSPRDLLDEWTIGIDTRHILAEQQERELIEKLSDPLIRYLDFYTTDFDHAAHHNNDRATQLNALRELDGVVGRIWTAIRQTPQAQDTVLVMVSDHGSNSDERVYSQGYSVVRLLTSATGGGHHVVTKRRILSDYALKSVYPLVSHVYTTSRESFYLKGEGTNYPTALVDFDGNERTSIHLRDSDLNLLHILLLELRRSKLAPALRSAASELFFDTIERRRAGWQREVSELFEEVGALRLRAARQQRVVEALPKEWTKEERDLGLDREAQRQVAHLSSLERDVRDYEAYAQTLEGLLALRRETFKPSSVRIENVIARGAMGDANSLHDMQNYVVGLRPSGLALAPDGSLDAERSFTRVNYFRLLGGVSVRNNVQPGVSNRPVDFIAVRLDADSFNEAAGEELRADDVVWLYKSEERQALILALEDDAGAKRIRYLPVRNLRQDASGRITFDRAAWSKGFPLGLWEDPLFAQPAGGAREEWLGGWHTDVGWLRASHRTRYAHAVVSLHEQLARHRTEAIDYKAVGINDEERLIRRFRARQRRLVEADLLVVANDHWNFDVRGFNPGGNHGSFLRVSSHSTLMFAGGERTGVPRGHIVTEPYDSLSFMPTLLTLAGKLDGEGRPVPLLRQQGFRRFPGRIISEVLGAGNSTVSLTADEEGARIER